MNIEEPNYELEETQENNISNDESTAISLIDYVHDLVVDSRAIPMSASVMINKAQMLDLLDQIREALPRDVRTADDIVHKADAVLDRANSEAEARIHDAQVRADTIVAQAEEEANVVKTNASNQAERTLNDANSRAEQIIADAQAQAERMVSAEEVLRVATERAHETTRSAQTQADELIVNANDYARNKMSDLMQAALDVARIAEGGRDRIDQRLAEHEEAMVAESEEYTD